MGTKTISTTTQVLEREIKRMEESIIGCQEIKQPLVDKINNIDERIEAYEMQINAMRDDLNRLYPPTE